MIEPAPIDVGSRASLRQDDSVRVGEPPATEEKTEDVDVEKQPPVEEDLPPPYTIFTTWEKRVIVFAAATAAFFSPFSAHIYFPALPAIAEDLNVSISKVNLTITTYMIFQGITPMFIGSLADSGGRRPAYIITFVIYIAACIGVALAPDYDALLGLRCLQSAGSSSTVALAVAVIADVVTSAERGQYIGFTVVPIVLAPSLGPVLGGVLSQYLGWRWIFWFLTILAGVTIVLVAMFFPETNRHIVGDGSLTPPPMYRSGWQILQRRRRNSNTDLSRQTSAASKSKSAFKFKYPNVLGSLIMLGEKETFLLLSYSSVVFAGFYTIATAMPTLFAKNYGFDQTTVGLMFLPLAGGSIGAAVIAGIMVNRNFQRYCVKLGIPYDRTRQQDLSEFPVEKARLEVGTPLVALAAVSTISWGWAVQYKAHIAVPCVLGVLMGIGFVGFNNTSNALLVDIHPGQAGTATAASNLTRCLIGAGASAAIIPMIDAMGAGWAFTLIGGLYILYSPSLLALMVWGPRWRAELKEKRARKAAAKAKDRESNASEEEQTQTQTDNDERSITDKAVEDDAAERSLDGKGVSDGRNRR